MSSASISGYPLSPFTAHIERQLVASSIPAKGFGFHVGSSLRFYSVEIPQDGGPVMIHEVIMQDIPSPLSLRLKACVERHQWKAIASGVAACFNEALGKQKQPKGAWGVGHTPIAEHFGKELLTLAYAIDDMSTKERQIAWAENALLAWCALAPEERWWLFLKAESSAGWKASLKVSLARG